MSGAPVAGYATHAPDGSDADLEPDCVLSVDASSRYEYGSTTHGLSPRANVYIIKTQEGGFYKLAITGYYNAAGSSGYPTLRWAKVASPSAPIESAPLPRADAGMDAVTGATTVAP